MDTIILSEKDIARFNSKIIKTESCWLWTDALTNGYGYLGVGGRKGRKIEAHRIAYILQHDHIPDGLHIDHICRNRACVNPAHLEAVTQRINLLRGNGISAVNASKTTCIRGHDLLGYNAYINPKTKRRQCRICSNECKQKKRKNTSICC